MTRIRGRGGRIQRGDYSRVLLALMGCGGMFTEVAGRAQSRESLAGEGAVQAMKRSLEAEEYNLEYGPMRLRAGASAGVSYTDNVFYSRDRKEDLLIRPEITVDALWPITQLNALRLSLGLSYEWYQKNRELNGDAPLVSPGSELVFNLFAGDFHIRLHDRFSYQESLFFNSLSGDDARFYNFNDVGVFSRLNNEAGVHVDWDLNKVILSAGYNHETFISTTSSFDYLNRDSEWFTASAGFHLGDHARAGLESQASLHSYEEKTILDDNWRARGGVFVEHQLPGKISARAGGGAGVARYDADPFRNSDYESWYGYARIRQDTRAFSHTLAAGYEHLLGDNANNLKTTYARYSITSPIVAHVDVQANVSVNFAEEFGGAFQEQFTYYAAGIRVGSQFHKHWRADLAYEFRLKESDLESREYHRNRVTLSASYIF